MKKKFDVTLSIKGTASAAVYAYSKEEAEELAVDGKWEDLQLIQWSADEVESVGEGA